jgi:hypothetical protein
MAIFDEQYRVVAVESQCLIIRGIQSGNVLTINAGHESSISQEEYPIGKLIVLTDPSAASSVH